MTTTEQLFGWILAVWSVGLPGFVLIENFVTVQMRNLLLNSAWIGERVRFVSRAQTWPLVGITLAYGALTLITLGFAYSWLKVRRARYFADCTEIVFEGPLDQVVEEAVPEGSAAAEQLGEAFDLGFDFGF